MSTDSNDTHQAHAIRDEHGILTYLPVCSSDDDRRASKLGGVPWLDGPWPICPTCTNPLRFVLQLRRDDVPPSCQWAFGADLIQLFVCDARGKPDAPEWRCQADGQGWQPFAPSTLVCQVDPGPEALEPEKGLPIEVRLDVARLEHAARRAFAQAVGFDPPDVPTLADLRARAKQLLERPSSSEAFLIRQPWIYPVQRITRWDEQLDVPRAVLERWIDARLDRLSGRSDTELEREFKRAWGRAEQLGLVCSTQDKLAGAPAWVQEEFAPACRSCGSSMRNLFQIGTGSPVADAICDGIGWLFVCPDCHEGTYTWQR